MKRAIYIGKTELYTYAYNRHPLHYGMTGDTRPYGTDPEWVAFRVDGQVNGSLLKREEI